jgi:hypothetical protein
LALYRRAALLLALPTLTWSLAGRAKLPADGAFAGRMRCEALERAGWGPFDQPVTLKVVGSVISYEHRVLVPATGGASSEYWERGTGTIGRAGEITIESSGTTRVSKYAASWAGRRDGDAIRLQGVQHWQIGRSAETLTRCCTIEATRSS